MGLFCRSWMLFIEQNFVMSKYLLDISESFKNYKKYYINKIANLRQIYKSVKKVEFSEELKENPDEDFIKFQQLNHNPSEYNLSRFELILREKGFFSDPVVLENDRNIQTYIFEFFNRGFDNREVYKQVE